MWIQIDMSVRARLCIIQSNDVDYSSSSLEFHQWKRKGGTSATTTKNNRNRENKNKTKNTTATPTTLTASNAIFV